MTDLLSNIREYTVSELAHSLKRMVEEKYSYVKVRGEVSGLKIANSGHIYFDIKDDNGLLNVVCWKGKASSLTIKPEDGLEVFCYGKISSYPQRSNYQLVLDKLEVAGEGALMQLLEKRKKEMQAKGYFDQARKKPLPKFPKRIAVVTSITGAVIKDILHRVGERYPLNVLVYPVAVQGKGAEHEIATAINDLNQIESKPDIIIVARGGGSIEDLWCFNEEEVVLATVNSHIPIISAVGHETDFTLIDYAADLRAPTPTAAAEISTPVLSEVKIKITDIYNQIAKKMLFSLQNWDLKLKNSVSRLPNLSDIISNKLQRLDDIGSRYTSSLNALYHKKSAKLISLAFSSASLESSINLKKTNLNNNFNTIEREFNVLIERLNNNLQSNAKLIESYNYKNVMKRGYSIVRDDAGNLVKNASMIAGSQYEVEFHDGKNKVEAR